MRLGGVRTRMRLGGTRTGQSLSGIRMGMSLWGVSKHQVIERRVDHVPPLALSVCMYVQNRSQQENVVC